MGLDMFLSAKPKRKSSVYKQAAYWRKANMIHKWFVDNVQNGVDDCGEYEVSHAKINELISLCEKVKTLQGITIIKNESLLPTQEGFFFGSTEYDDDYFDGIEYTIYILKEAVYHYPEKDYTFVYSSSW